MELVADAVWTGATLRVGVAVEVSDGVVARIGPPSGHGRRLPGRVLLPGLVNAHSHAFQRAIRGHVQRMSGADDFWTWRDAMYRVANGLDPEGVEAVSRLAFLEMAEAGVTAVGEFHYVHHAPDGTPYDDPDLLARRVIVAARDVGIRIALLRVVYGRSGHDTPLRPDQRRFGDRSVDDALAAVSRLGSLSGDAVRIGLAPHSVRAVPEAWLAELAAFEGVVHSHVSEQPKDVADCIAATGRSPIAVLADAGLLTSRFTAVHWTHPVAGDADLLREARAAVCVCPTTELDLGDGVYGGPADLRTVVGTDSHARIDIFEEARLVDGFARATRHRRSASGTVPAERVLRVATDGTPLGFGRGIRVGAPADLVAVDVSGPASVGVPLLEAVAFGASARNVTDVWVGGRAIVTDGVHPDRAAIVDAAVRHMLEC